MTSFLHFALPAFAILGSLVPLAAGQGRRLSGPLARPIGGDILAYQVSPDGARVVYVADEDTDQRFELFSAKPSAAGTRIQLSGPAVEGGSVASFVIGTRSRQVVFSGDLETDGVRELFSVSIDGGARVKLASGAVDSFQIDSRETRVLYRARIATSSNERGLFSVPIDGGPATLLSSDAGFQGVSSFLISPDGRRALYVSDEAAPNVRELFSVPLTGGIAVKLNPPGVRVEATGMQIDSRSLRVVFAVSAPSGGATRLYSAPLGGRRPAIELLSDPVFDLELVRLSPDGTRVVCLARGAQLELTSVPIDGRPGSAVLYSLPNAFDQRIEAIELSHDGRSVFFDAFSDSSSALFRAPIDGSTPATELAQTLASELRLSPDGRFIVFQGTAGLSSARIDVPAAPVLVADAFASTFEIAPDSARVVYEARLEGTNSVELFSAPIAGGKLPVRLSPELPFGGTVQGFNQDFQISAVTGRVIYRASQDARDLFELFSVPLDGGAAPLQINGQLPIGPVEGDVWRMALSSDGVRAVYVADQETDNVVELFSVPANGRGQPTKLCEDLEPSQQVNTFGITPEGTRVVYRVEELGGGPNRLLVVPIAGGPSTVLATGQGHGDLLLDPTGTRVVFTMAEGFVNKQFSVTLDGSSAPVELTGPRPSGSRITTPDGSRVLYVSAADGGSNAGLFSVPIDGSASAVQLDLATFALAGVVRFEVDAVGSRVVYLARHRAGGSVELFSSPVDGSAAAVRLNPVLIGSRTVAQFALAPTGFAFYTSDQDVGQRFELYRVPTDGSSAPTKVNASLGTHGSVQTFLITPDGARAVYVADQEVDGRAELYSVSSDGSGPVRKLNGPLGDGDVGGDPAPDSNAVLAMGPDGKRVVFTAGPAARGSKRLYSAPSDGSAPALEIGGSVPYGLFGLSIAELRFTAGGTAVVYSVLHDHFEGFALYHAPLDLTGRAKRVSGIANGDARRFIEPPFALTPDGQRIVFLNDQLTRGVAELFENFLPPALRSGKSSGTVTIIR
jgi:Tol biopolymer transport system component